jgi:hypothetical protein
MVITPRLSMLSDTYGLSSRPRESNIPAVTMTLEDNAMETTMLAKHWTASRLRVALGCMLLCVLPAIAAPQQRAQPVDEEEQMDSALRKYGYVSGQACQCQTQQAEKTMFERRSLDTATGILRLFGSDRAFFYAAAFGAGLTVEMDQKTCPDILKQHDAMVARLKVLGTR